MGKKVFHKLTACTLSAVLAMASFNFSNLCSTAADSILNCEYENGTDNWSGRGSASVTLDSQNYYLGSNSLFVSGRTDSWNGAAISLSSTFATGTAYSFSAAVLQKTGTAVDVKMTLQYTLNGTDNYDQIALVSVQSGVWTDVSNASYTIPSGAENLILYFELPDSMADFYIDSFTAATAGTASPIVTGGGVIDGNAQADTNTSTTTNDSIRGDFDNSGSIDSMDILSAKNMLLKRFSGSTDTIDLNIADVDGNGDFSAADIKMLQQYILGEIKEFPEITVQTTTTTTTTTAITTNPQNETTTTTTSSSQTGDGNYMDRIASDIQIDYPSSFTQERAGVDYGTMVSRSYYSKDGQITKNVNILLPPGYNENESYPVLYVLHGIFGDENSMPGMGIQTMLGNLIADGEAEKMIVVFPAMFTGSGSPGFTAESSRKYDLIREDIENSIMPFLEENYSVKTGRDNTAITGFSMGGREALYTGITRSEVYGYVGAACPAPGIFATTDNYMTHEGCLTESEFKPSTSPYMILISAAQNDSVVGTYPQTYHDALTNNGVQHLWQTIPSGDHGGATVTPHMYNFLRHVFKAS